MHKEKVKDYAIVIIKKSSVGIQSKNCRISIHYLLFIVQLLHAVFACFYKQRQHVKVAQ